MFILLLSKTWHYVGINSKSLPKSLGKEQAIETHKIVRSHLYRDTDFFGLIWHTHLVWLLIWSFPWDKSPLCPHTQLDLKLSSAWLWSMRADHWTKAHGVAWDRLVAGFMALHLMLGNRKSWLIWLAKIWNYQEHSTLAELSQVKSI